MNKKILFFIITIVVIFTLIIFLNQSITQTSTPDTNTKQEEEPQEIIQEETDDEDVTTGFDCPTDLHATYTIDTKNNTVLSDDDILLKIVNLDEQNWDLEILVNDYSEGSLNLKPKETATLHSTYITSWWISSDRGVDEDDETIEDEPNKKNFKIYFFVEGCGFTSGTVGVGFDSKRDILSSTGENGGASSVEVIKSEQIHD